MKLLAQTNLGLPGNNKTIPEDLKNITTGREFDKYSLSGTTPADLINNLLLYIFILAGIILLFMIISGGFTIFVSAGNPEKIKKGTSTITSGLIGFIIIFAAYWIIQLLEYTFGIKLL